MFNIALPIGDVSSLPHTLFRNRNTFRLLATASQDYRARNTLILAQVGAGKPLRWYVGAAWTRSGDFKSEQDWQRYVAAEAARARTPVTVNLAGGH
ncbi:MAG: hypothetical protein JWR65_3603 [Massilia sp.]|nr:hypothetical protein [Massilia sp.]